MKTLLTFILLLTANSVVSQSAREKDPILQDSLNYYQGIRYYKNDRMKKAKNIFLRIFNDKHNKWCDSVKAFLNAKGKFSWLVTVDEESLNGYKKADSIYYEEGKKLFNEGEYRKSRDHFFANRNYWFKYSIYKDSVDLLNREAGKRLDSIYKAELEEKKKSERSWVYLGIYEQFNKYGEYNGDDMTYFDENNLLFEGDSVCVVIKSGDSYFGDYRYVSLNLNTRIVHGIDASFIRNGISYNYIWDGDWWNTNSGFGDDLYRAIIKYK